MKKTWNDQLIIHYYFNITNNENPNSDKYDQNRQWATGHYQISFSQYQPDYKKLEMNNVM